MNNHDYQRALYDYLLPYVTTNKQRRFEEVLNYRTRALTVVLEDIFKPHNASAVLRTAECLGLQEVHVVEQDNSFNLNPYVLRGSGKWLTINHHRRINRISTIEQCLRKLKESGHYILASTPDQGAVDYNQVELPAKTAVVFGSEENGVTDYVLDSADQLIKIPMHGFTESFNISVSAAMILENFNRKLRSKDGWQLSKREKFELKLEWVCKVVKNLEVHIREFDRQWKE